MATTGEVIQKSFSAGEISPEMVARTDLDRYHSALKTCLNFIISPTGDAKNRAGTKFVRATKNPADRVRLLSFTFNKDQSYCLEVGDGYMRFHRDGATIMEPEADGTGSHDAATHATILTDSGESWEVNKYVGQIITNTTDGSIGTITANTATTITVTPALAGGTDNQWESGDLYEIPLEVATPLALANISALKKAQQNDVMFFVHRDYPCYVLQRHADNAWSIAVFSITKPVDAPTGLGVTAAPAAPAPQTWGWVVTTVDEFGRESLPTAEVQDASSGLDATVTWVAPTTGYTPNHYNIYRGLDGIYGYVGRSNTLQYIDRMGAVNYGDIPPGGKDPFSKTLIDAITNRSISFVVARR